VFQPSFMSQILYIFSSKTSFYKILTAIINFLVTAGHENSALVDTVLLKRSYLMSEKYVGSYMVVTEARIEHTRVYKNNKSSCIIVLAKRFFRNL